MNFRSYPIKTAASSGPSLASVTSTASAPAPVSFTDQLTHLNPHQSSSIYLRSHIPPDFINHNQLEDASANFASSNPLAPSLFDFQAQGIDLYDFLNSQPFSLTIPPPRSINPTKNPLDHISLALEENLPLNPVDQPPIIQKSQSYGFYPDTLQHSHPSTLQDSFHQDSLSSQKPKSAGEIPISLEQSHPPTSPTTFYPGLLDFQSQSTTHRFPFIDSIGTHLTSTPADKFECPTNEPLISNSSFNVPSNSLQVAFLNQQVQPHTETKPALKPLTIASVGSLAQLPRMSSSDQSNGKALVQSNSPTLKTSTTTTGTQSQEFRRRKDWAKRLVEDIEDVLQLVTPTGELVFLNESMSRLTGFKTSELLSTELFEWCFDGEDRNNLKREINNCVTHGNQLNLFCRFKKKDSDGFVILEMLGHMIEVKANAGKPIEEEKLPGKVIYITGRLYPTGCGQLMDDFLELVIENERMERRLRLQETGCPGSSGEEEQEGGMRKPVDKKRQVTGSPRVELMVDKDEEWGDESHGHVECFGQPTIGRESQSRPRKRPKKDKSSFFCRACGVTQSPEWRRGPEGRKTLCNACGLRYAKTCQVVKNVVDHDNLIIKQ